MPITKQGNPPCQQGMERRVSLGVPPLLLGPSRGGMRTRSATAEVAVGAAVRVGLACCLWVLESEELEGEAGDTVLLEVAPLLLPINMWISRSCRSLSGIAARALRPIPIPRSAFSRVSLCTLTHAMHPLAGQQAGLEKNCT